MLECLSIRVSVFVSVSVVYLCLVSVSLSPLVSFVCVSLLSVLSVAVTLSVPMLMTVYMSAPVSACL